MALLCLFANNNFSNGKPHKPITLTNCLSTICVQTAVTIKAIKNNQQTKWISDITIICSTYTVLVYCSVLHKHKVQCILALLYNTCRVPGKIFYSHNGVVHSKLYWLLIGLSILASSHVQFLPNPS